jgi:hypothetical protein
MSHVGNQDCSDSLAEALRLAHQVVLRIQPLRKRFHRLARLHHTEVTVHLSTLDELNQNSSRQDTGRVLGMLVYEHGRHRVENQRCPPGQLCAQRFVLDPDGIYLWLNFYTEPLSQQNVLETFAIGPLRITAVIQVAERAPDRDDLARAIYGAITRERDLYDHQCPARAREPRQTPP